MLREVGKLLRPSGKLFSLKWPSVAMLDQFDVDAAGGWYLDFPYMSRKLGSRIAVCVLHLSWCDSSCRYKCVTRADTVLIRDQVTFDMHLSRDV